MDANYKSISFIILENNQNYATKGSEEKYIHSFSFSIQYLYSTITVNLIQVSVRGTTLTLLSIISFHLLIRPGL